MGTDRQEDGATDTEDDDKVEDDEGGRGPQAVAQALGIGETRPRTVVLPLEPSLVSVPTSIVCSPRHESERGCRREGRVPPRGGFPGEEEAGRPVALRRPGDDPQSGGRVSRRGQHAEGRPRALLDKRVSGAPVINRKGRIVGVLSMTDIIWVESTEAMNLLPFHPSETGDNGGTRSVPPLFSLSLLFSSC